MTEATPNDPWSVTLWDYVVDIYAQPEVEKLSLAWQETYRANVNMLLWCVWLDRQGINLSADVLGEVSDTINAIEQTLLVPMRQARTGLADADMFTRVQKKLVKKQILSAELSVEKIVVHKLQDMTRKYLEVMPDQAQPLKLRDYLLYLGVAGAGDKADLFASACQTDERSEAD